MRFGTLFSGGEGVGIGLAAAGLHHAWGIEYDADIAAVAQRNGFAVTMADVRSVDYAALPRVDWLHASPVCTRASVANSGATESDEDISMAAAVVRSLEAQTPQIFSLENVWQYRTFAAFRLICDALGRMGYFWTYDHVNAADYGVPQTRRRLILRASRGLLPMLPEPVPWVGWYAAIEDLLPSLPESRLAPWQLARLPVEMRGAVLVGGGNTQLAQVDSKARELSEPAFTITGSTKNTDNRAVLIDQINSRDGAMSTMRQADEPVWTISAYSPKHQGPRALLSARVVSMTPRALARFQSVPDAYILPDKRTLAARVIGNMVPPLLMQRIAEGFLA